MRGDAGQCGAWWQRYLNSVSFCCTTLLPDAPFMSRNIFSDQTKYLLDFFFFKTTNRKPSNSYKKKINVTRFLLLASDFFSPIVALSPHPGTLIRVLTYQIRPENTSWATPVFPNGEPACPEDGRGAARCCETGPFSLLDIHCKGR